MSKPLCLVTAPVATRSGYGAHSRDICRALIKLDRYDVRIWNVRWGSTPMNALIQDDPNDKIIIDKLIDNPNLPRQPDIHIHIVIPTEFQPMAKYNIGITAGLEMTVCPPQWIEGMNRMNMNIVPSNFVKEIMSRCTFEIRDDNSQEVKGTLKSENPIEVLFEGTDTNNPDLNNISTISLVDEMKKVDDTFNFLYVGHWLAGGLGKDRKDTGMLLKVFFEAFKNMKKQPGLIMKTSGAGFSVLDREDILKKIEEIKHNVDGKLPNVYFLHGDFTDDEMNQLYNHPKVKAHITLTHGEGFGRPLLEATISQKPVIAPNWSGHVDFLGGGNAILLPGSLNDIKKESFPKNMYMKEAQWFTVNYNYASKMLQDVFDNYSKYIVKGKKLAIVNQTKFSLDAMTKKFEEILDKYLPKFEEQPTPVDLKLPKLKKVGEVKERPKIELPKLKKI